VAWSRDGSVVAGAPTLHEVRLWDAADGSPLPSLTGHADWVHAVAFAPDGRHLASAGGGEYLRGDNLIRLWPLPLPRP
jgi:WD40 repeat protein